MDRLTPEDRHLPTAAEGKPMSSSYYTYARPSQNGYTSIAVVPSQSLPASGMDETSDTESERVGVFDYVLSSSSQRSNSRSLPSTLPATVDNDRGISPSSRQKWAQNLHTLADEACSNRGTELTTFCCNSSDTHSQSMNDDVSCSTGARDAKIDTADDCSSELEEIVVHSEVQSQRASYERFDPDFPYTTGDRGCSSSSTSGGHEPATVFVTSVNKSAGSQSSSSHTTAVVDTSEERDLIEKRSRHYTSQYNGLEQGDLDSPSESSSSAIDKDPLSSSTLNPVPLTTQRSTTTIMQTPNIVYLNDWWGSGRTFVSDMTLSDEHHHRYGMLGPRSETGRRLYNKRHRRQQRQADDTSTSLSQNCSEYKGDLPVDKLLAFINSDKVVASALGETSPNSKLAASSSGSKKVRHRRKKQPGDRSEDSDAASVSTMDTASLCSGYEFAESIIDSIADAEIEIHHHQQPTLAAAVPNEGATGLYDNVRSTDFDLASSASEHDRFVVVQKKRKARVQPVPENLPPRRHETSTSAYSSFTSTQATHGRLPLPPETCRTDDTVSLTSDTDSSWSYSRESGSKAASVRCSSPDFPDLIVQGGGMPGRQNSTGNVCLTVQSFNENALLPPSTISYAIVAAGGLRSNTTMDVESQRSSDVSTDAVSHSQAEQPGASDKSAESESFCNNNNLPSVGDMHADSKMLLENFHPTDANRSEQSTPTVDSHSIVTDDLAKELSEVKLQKLAKQNLQMDSHAAAIAFSSKCDRKLMLGGCCDRRTRTSPVVFLDTASGQHRLVRSGNLGGVSFGFDSSDGIGNIIVGHSECSSSESGFSDCTVHTDTQDKISSTDSATSPIDPQDLVPVDTVPTGMVQQTVTIAHCRPIVPFVTGGTCSHTPVGIVPPIPQVERPSETLDRDMAKDSKKEDILSSVIDVTQKHEILHRELLSAAADKMFLPRPEKSSSVLSAASDSVVSSVCSAAICTSMSSSPVSGFNLLATQMFLYADYENVLLEKRTNSGMVLQYCEASM